MIRRLIALMYGPCGCLCPDCVNGGGHCGGIDCGQSGKWFTKVGPALAVR